MLFLKISVFGELEAFKGGPKSRCFGDRNIIFGKTEEIVILEKFLMSLGALLNRTKGVQGAKIHTFGYRIVIFGR